MCSLLFAGLPAGISGSRISEQDFAGLGLASRDPWCKAVLSDNCACVCVGLRRVCLCSTLRTQPVVISNQSMGTQSTAPGLSFVICPLCPSIILSIYHTPQFPLIREPQQRAKIITACQHLVCDKLEDFFFLKSLSHTGKLTWLTLNSSSGCCAVRRFKLELLLAFWSGTKVLLTSERWRCGSTLCREFRFLLQGVKHCSASTSEG